MCHKNKKSVKETMQRWKKKETAQKEKKKKEKRKSIWHCKRPSKMRQMISKGNITYLK